jgi:Sigma-70, region 4
MMESTQIPAATLDSLQLPARMVNFAAEHKLGTLADIAKLHPAALLLERNLGRGTIAKTREVLEPILGTTWEQAALRTSGAVLPQTLSTQPWDRLAHTVSSTFFVRLLTQVSLPARMRTFAELHGLSTVGELIALPFTALIHAPNLGPTTIANTHAILIALEETVDASVSVREWKALLQTAIEKLPSREQLVLMQRSGLRGAPLTLEVLGKQLGVTRERVRQLETSAINTIRRTASWLARIELALEPLVPQFAQRLDALALKGSGEPFIDDIEQDADAFRFLVEDLLALKGVHIYTFEETAYFGAATASEFTAKLGLLRRVCDAQVFPIPREGFQEKLAHAASLSDHEATLLFDLLACDFTERDGNVIALGKSRAREVEVYLRMQAAPVSVDKVCSDLGRMPMPACVVWIDRGLVTLAEFIPGFTAWQARLGPVVCSLLAEHDLERQWTTAEILPLLETVAELPEWLNQYSLGSLLRNAIGLQYLGRNVVALASTETLERSHILDLLESALLEAGGPLEEQALLEVVRRTRGLADLTWTMQRMRAPFLLFASKKVGLFPRDVPGGSEHAAPFCERVFQWLEARERGADSRDFDRFTKDLPEPMCSWDARLTRSLLRHDGKFRQAQGGGGIGLAVWGETRTPTQKEVLNTLLAKSQTVSVAEALRRLPTASGDAIPRTRLALLATLCGAKLVNNEIVKNDALPRQSAEDAKDSDWVMKMPERASATFASYLRHARTAEQLSHALSAWREALLLSDLDTIDRPQVHDLAKRAAQLLKRLNVESGPLQDRVIRAAVEYLVDVTDAECDTLVGGLDDDDAVLRVVEVACGLDSVKVGKLT